MNKKSAVASSYFDTSLWEFLSPSKVKGDAPVRSSNIRIPRLHQSTDWKKEIRHFRRQTRGGSAEFLIFTLPCPAFPLMISGAMYSMVPQKEYVLSFWSESSKCITTKLLKSSFKLLIVPLYLLFQKLLTEPKICQNDVSFAVQENVFQLDVSVNDPELQQKHNKATEMSHNTCWFRNRN